MRKEVDLMFLIKKHRRRDVICFQSMLRKAIQSGLYNLSVLLGHHRNQDFRPIMERLLGKGLECSEGTNSIAQ